jgi:hypothetical protein
MAQLSSLSISTLIRHKLKTLKIAIGRVMGWGSTHPGLNISKKLMQGKALLGRTSFRRVALLCLSLPPWSVESSSKRGQGLKPTKRLKGSRANKNFKMFSNLSLTSVLWIKGHQLATHHWHQALLQRLSLNRLSKRTKQIDISTSTWKIWGSQDRRSKKRKSCINTISFC